MRSNVKKALLFILVNVLMSGSNFVYADESMFSGQIGLSTTLKSTFINLVVLRSVTRVDCFRLVLRFIHLSDGEA